MTYNVSEAYSSIACQEISHFYETMKLAIVILTPSLFNVCFNVVVGVLGCNVVWTCTTFRRIMMPPSSELK
jgi:hypothetical protein